MRNIDLFIFSIIIFTLFQCSNQFLLRRLQDEDSDNVINHESISDGIEIINGTDSNISKLYLLGFGEFKRPEKKKITFKIYFKRNGTITMGKSLTFHIKINYVRRLRLLEEKEELTTCTQISETVNKINFACEAPVDENRDFTSVTSLNDYSTENGAVLSELTTTSLNANIVEKTDTSLENESFDLLNGVLKREGKTFTIEGIIENGNTFSQKELTLILNDNNNVQDVPCKVSNSGINYKLECYPEESISNAKLENVMCKGNNQNLLIHMNNPDETVTISDEDLPINNYNRKNSSGGLSGGAIAGIVIACVIVLFGVIVTFLLCRRSSKPPIQESTMEIYTNGI